MKKWINNYLDSNFLFGLFVLSSGSFLIMLSTNQVILPLIYILLFSMTYFLFVEFKNHEMISYKNTAMILTTIFIYVMTLLNQEQPIIYYITFIIPFLFLFSLSSKVFYTSLIINSFFQFTLITIAIHSGILKDETAIKDYPVLNFLTFTSLQTLFVFIYLKIKRIIKENKYKEDLFAIETTTLETDLHNLYFSKEKTSETVFYFHQFIHNLDKTKKHYQDFLDKVNMETLKSKKNESDVNYLLEKILDSLDEIRESLESEQQKVLKYQKASSKNLTTSQEEIKTLENVIEVNEDNETNLNTLIDSTSTIHSLIELIRGVSNQINLLSLNASIEASKTGEVGKGFSGIAKEIKHLQIEVLDTLTEITSEIATIENSFNNLKDGNRKIERKTEELLGWKNETKELNREINEFIKNYLVSNELSNQKLSLSNTDINNSLKKLNDIIESTSIVENEVEESFIIFNQQKKITNQLKNLLHELQNELLRSSNSKVDRKK